MNKWVLAAMGVGGVIAWWKMSRKSISQEGLELIKQHEGLVLHVYNDAAGYPTIGYGHLIKEGEHFTEITEAQAEALLRVDVRAAENAVNRYVKVTVSQSQFDALVSFTFNLGAGALQESTLLKKLNAGDYEGAAVEFPRWVYAGGARLAGLVSRRHDEQGMFVGAVA